MVEPLRVLLVGVGTRGQHWARIMDDEPLCHTVGYMDTDAAALKIVDEHWPVPAEALFSDLGEALDATAPDLVVLATPPMGHLDQARLIFAHGCHLLSEKPLTLDLTEAITIVQGAQEAGVSLTVGLNFRYLAATIEAKRIFAEQELGAPSFGQYLYWTNRDGRRPGINKYPLTMHQPMLYEQSIHHLDLFRFTYGAEAARVSAITHNPTWSMYADDANVFALIEMTNGIVVNYFGTWSGTTKLRTFEWRTDCSEGAVIQRDFFKDLAIVAKDSDEPRAIELIAQEDYVDDTRAMFRHIVRQILDGVSEPTPSGRDHLMTMALTVACEESARNHAVVEMADFYRRHEVPQEWLK
jgi:predicted dehydrogenase